AAAREYVQRVASEHNADFQVDDYGNIVVRVNASSQVLSNVPVIAFQSHLDMVCQHLPDVAFDPLRDSIKVHRDGERIYANGTTLGADNGIGASVMLALLTSSDVKHGPLELLFTVEEEIGLIGALRLDPALVTARTMINLDSTSTTEVTVGCAGGEGVDMSLELQPQMRENCQCYQIQVSGLQGGHSGVQIDEPRANAIKLLTKVLLQLPKDINWNLCDFKGGSAHNAIPRDASASIAVSVQDVLRLEELIAEQAATLNQSWKNDEPGLQLKLLLAEDCKSTFDVPSSLVAIELLDALPHGVQKMSERFEGKVETSCNLANVEIVNNLLKLHVSSRSLIDEELHKLQEHVLKIGRDIGADADRTEGYPGWEPRTESKISEIASCALRKANGKEPQVEVIHAGVECGVIASKIDDLDVISIGAELYALHSPEESVVIPSVEIIWNAVRDILVEYAGEEVGS
ncbi:MAG: beta-Ala-His dipeptidase, partial [Abditibacteriaceae bacterium]